MAMGSIKENEVWDHLTRLGNKIAESTDQRITARINHMTKLSTTLITIQVTIGK